MKIESLQKCSDKVVIWEEMQWWNNLDTIVNGWVAVLKLKRNEKKTSNS